jgi:HEPN domain-containing protein
LLALKNQMPPKTHDLSLLMDICKPFYPEIMSISVQSTALNPYSSQPRYPREMLITEQGMQAAIKNAKAVYAFVQIQCAPGLPITG